MAQNPSLDAIDHDAIVQALTAFVDANIMARGLRIQPDDEFEMMGIDSMAMLKVLLFVESEFGFWPPDEDLIMENLRSPRALAHYIGRRRSVS
jgi:acyl carrier protein